MIQCFNYVSLKICVHNWLLLTMLDKGLAVWAHNVVSWASDAPTQLIHHSPSPHLWTRPQITSSYHLLTNQDEAVLWNNGTFLNWRKLNSLTKASNMNHYFTLALRQPKKYISIVRCGLYYFTVQNISAKVKEALLASNSKSHYTKCHLFQLLHFSTLQMIRKILFYWAFQTCTRVCVGMDNVN